MSFRFRPKFDALEAREVPAAFSFVLSNTAIGSGLFSTPADVDPNQSSQTLELTDLSIVVGGDRVDLDGPATATYANGVLVGITASGSNYEGSLQLSGSTVTFDSYPTTYSGSIIYDAADTQITFAMPDRTEGAISYQVPWDQVDPALPTQSITPTAFNLNIAGQNVSSGFTTAPTLTFEYGNLVGVNFAVGALAGAGYSSLSMAGLAVTAVQAWNGQPQFTTAAPTNFLILDFNPVTTGADYNLTVAASWTGGVSLSVQISIGKAATPAQIRDAVYEVLKDAGVDVVKADTSLTIKAAGGEQLKSVRIYTTTGIGGAFRAPAYVAKYGNVDYNK